MFKGGLETEFESLDPTDGDEASFSVQEKSRMVSAPKPARRREGRHGAKNHHKMKFLVKWLQETFPHAFSNDDDDSSNNGHVLDVAGGGKGELATRLAWCYQRRVVIFDPRHADLVTCLEKTVLPQLPKKWQERAKERAALVERAQSGEGPHHDGFGFILNELVVQHQICVTPQSIFHDPILTDAIQKASLIVGMHADGATEPIVDAALHYQKPFVVVPCCVFPNLFQQRTILVKAEDVASRQKGPQFAEHDNVNDADEKSLRRVQVRSYEDFCQYLLERDSRFQSTVLPFPGRNLAIWWDGKD